MPDNLIDEVARQLRVCNACRYCEGYCAVWPAMERRTAFEEKDVIFLANLCYNCRDCYSACPFTPPHEFNINIPQAMSEVRLQTYQKQTAPEVTSSLFKRPGRAASLFATLSIIALFLFSSAIGNPSRLISTQGGLGSFYVIIPYWIIIVAGFTSGAYVLLAYFLEIRTFCIKMHGSFADFFKPKIVWLAAMDALKHTYFKGGGTGCRYPNEKGSYSFLSLHMMVFYGFLSAIVSTILAGVYQDYLGILPPYGLATPPVIFGILGGGLMIAGTSVLLYFKVISEKAPAFRKMFNLDAAFLITLDLVSITGFLTLVLRSTSALGVIFIIHLGLVLSLFLTAPYGKFVHFIYRFAALENDKLEQLKAVKT
ncbi:MAG: tricarballylate utilization 4Fe-4S protein TcuB [Nitrososphaerales archaeon]